MEFISRSEIIKGTGKWIDLTDKPVESIRAGLSILVDICPASRGRVRIPAGITALIEWKEEA